MTLHQPHSFGLNATYILSEFLNRNDPYNLLMIIKQEYG